MGRECGRCKKETVQGHHTNYCEVYGGILNQSGAKNRYGGKFIPRHMCCPGDCQLANPKELQDEIDWWKEREKEQNIDYEFAYEFTEKLLKFSLELQDGLDKDDSASV